MRALPELLPEIERIDDPPPLPPEATGAHPYIEAMKSDGLLADARGVDDSWLERCDGIGDPRHRLRHHELARRHANRCHLCRLYSWAIPNEQALARLAELSPLLELGAGGGYWAKLLRARGAEVVAYDRDPPPAEERRTGWSWRLWDRVDRGGLEALEQYPRLRQQDTCDHPLRRPRASGPQMPRSATRRAVCRLQLGRALGAPGCGLRHL